METDASHPSIVSLSVWPYPRDEGARIRCGASTYCRLEEPIPPMCTAVMEFDPLPSHAYNASHHSLGRRIAC